MSEANRVIIHRWFEEVWNQGRLGTIDELLAADGIMHGLTETGAPATGPAEFRPFVERFRGAFPDVSFKVVHTLVDGDMAALAWEATMTHRGDHLGIPATHRSVAITGQGMARIVNGQIVEGWNNWDRHALLEQLGLLAQPAVAAQ